MTVHDLPPSSRSLAYAHAVTVAIATRQPGTGCAGCGRTACRCVPITPGEVLTVREALSAAITGTEHPALSEHDRRMIVAALADAGCWRRLAGAALCERCHLRPADADSPCPPCEHNRADLDTATVYQRLGRWLAAFTDWAPSTPQPIGGVRAVAGGA